MKRILILSLCLFIVVGFSGCTTQPGVGEEKVIKIVTSNPMRTIQAGSDIVNAVKLAFDEVDNTVAGYKIEIVVEDDGDENGQWHDYLEEEIAKRAVADPDVMVYIGTYNSGAAKISIPITNKAGLVQISPVNTWPGLTKAGFLPGEPGIFYPTGVRTYFRVCPTDAVQGPAGAVWAEELGFSNIYIFDDGESYGKGIANLFEERVVELGLNVLGHDSINPENAKERLDAIRYQNPDLIYFGGVTANGAIPLAKGIKEFNMSAKLMGPDGIMEQSFVDDCGDAAEGVYLTIVGLPPTELTGKGEEFVDNYRAKYNKEPGPVSSFGYEAANVAILAIERAGMKDRGKILEEVSKIKDYDGLFGTWSFDQNGDTTLTIISGNMVKDGAFVFEKLLSAQ